MTRELRSLEQPGGFAARRRPAPFSPTRPHRPHSSPTDAAAAMARHEGSPAPAPSLALRRGTRPRPVRATAQPPRCWAVDARARQCSAVASASRDRRSARSRCPSLTAFARTWGGCGEDHRGAVLCGSSVFGNSAVLFAGAGPPWRIQSAEPFAVADTPQWRTPLRCCSQSRILPQTPPSRPPAPTRPTPSIRKPTPVTKRLFSPSLPPRVWS